MKLRTRLDGLLTQELDISFGPHFKNLEGFWCKVTKSDPEGVYGKAVTWADCGHGFTIREALEDALQVYHGHPGSSRSDLYEKE
jgi:hypothetical protein